MPEGCELSPVAAKVPYLLPFRGLHFIYLAHLKEVAISGLTTTNTICGIKSTELNGELHASLWVHLKVLDVVTKLEEYPDPRSIIYFYTVRPFFIFFTVNSFLAGLGRN